MKGISEYINNDFKPLDSKELVSDAQDFFADEAFSHFPILEDSVYIGCLSAEDVHTFDTDKTLGQYRYAMEGFFGRDNMIWLDALELFARNHTNVLPILDQANQYLGYCEVTDIIKLFNDTPFLKEPGGIVIVEKGITDYSMSQIVQIVESNNSKVLGVMLSETSDDTAQILVKVSMGSLNEIIQSFRRYNYEVVSEHQEDAYINSLKERSDYLDKYLNI